MYKLLQVFIEKKDQKYIVNVAVETTPESFKAFYAPHESISHYTINRVIEAGKTHSKDIAYSMFPELAVTHDYDNTVPDIDVPKDDLSTLSDLYESAKDKINSFILQQPGEQTEKGLLLEILAKIRDLAAPRIAAVETIRKSYSESKID